MRLLIITIGVLTLISCKPEVKNVLKAEQKMATFYADLEVSPQGTGEWLINGQKLTWGSQAISIVPNQNSLDTIFFREESPKWDTIICKIQRADSILFRYNDCCGGFHTINKAFRRNITPKIVFNIESYSDKFYLGDCTGASVLAKFNIKDTLKHACPRSAMFSNVYRITLSEIELTNKGAKGSISADCFYTNDKRTDGKFHYKNIKELATFSYVPLQEEVLTVNYNPKTGKTTIKID